MEAKLKECFDDISKRSGMIDLNAYKEVQAFDFCEITAAPGEIFRTEVMRKLQVPLNDDQMERVFESIDRNKAWSGHRS